MTSPRINPYVQADTERRDRAFDQEVTADRRVQTLA